ncbi:MAG: uroporphyrinogen-III synthase [Erythrobacter sp.]|nr:uroporphyrinogen-III synthase [Erythrobacter sp.]
MSNWPAILAIRPEPGLAATKRAARALGLEIEGEALFEIVPVDWSCPQPAAVDALLIGSANAILHGGEHLDRFLDKPVFAVGKATASAAQEAGFTIAAVGSGGLQNVIDHVPGPMQFLRIAGAEHVPLVPPKDIAIETVIAYESKALSLDPAIVDRLGDTPIVLLHSAVAAAHFTAEWDRLGLKRGDVTLAVLGPRIADAAGGGWHAVHVSPHPSDSALLEMIRDMCV